jgi:hypothetical protein
MFNQNKGGSMIAYDVLSLSGKTCLGTYTDPAAAAFIAVKINGKAVVRTKGCPPSERDEKRTANVLDWLARKDEVEDAK